jgi:hypothetical protein
MQYQLVVQFQANSREDFDRLVSFEQSLTKSLSGSATVDGHDFGSGEFNIFVLTDSPSSTFERVRKEFGGMGEREDMRAAYRELGGEDYIILWPPGLKEFTVS